MKKIRSIFLLLFMVVSVALFADPTPPFPLGKDNPPKGGSSGGGTGGDDGDKGHRAPARPAYCTIDFDASEVLITGYDCADIETFEIRDADAVNCIFATDDCAEFVAELASTNAPVYVIFYFDGFTLSGYFAR